jgi:hypothetical protein
MKKLILAGLVLALPLASAFAKAPLASDFSESIITAANFGELAPKLAIDWKVGAFQEYSIQAFGIEVGTVKRSVAGEQDNSVWISQDFGGEMIGVQKVETRYDRDSGKALEMKIDGKPAQLPAETGPEKVISRENVSLTVPAGTFETEHLVMKTDAANNLETWVARDLIMDGLVQKILDTGSLTLTLKLKTYSRE